MSGANFRSRQASFWSGKSDVQFPVFKVKDGVRATEPEQCRQCGQNLLERLPCVLGLQGHQEKCLEVQEAIIGPGGCDFGYFQHDAYIMMSQTSPLNHDDEFPDFEAKDKVRAI